MCNKVHPILCKPRCGSTLTIHFLIQYPSSMRASHLTLHACATRDFAV